MTFNNTWLEKSLQERHELGLFRDLPDYTGLVDFCSNDYIGISRNPKFGLLKRELLEKHNIASKEGATGSRLISGNSIIAEQTEKYISKFHKCAAALIYSTGYAANVGLLSAVAKRGDTIITDEHIHASLIDGARLSNASRFRFKHNDLSDLESKLKKVEGKIFVVVESIYSMDGDMAPLVEIADTCDKYGAYLIVDEAHAVGVYGNNGEGLVSKLGIEDKVWTRVVTFGKAIGTHGAAVLGDQILIDYLINFSRSFIYSTALPVDSYASINAAYQIVEVVSEERNQLVKNIAYFKKQAVSKNIETLTSNSAIQGVYVDGNKNGKRLEMKLRKNGLACKAILSPTVPKGKERLRVSIHSYNTMEEIDRLLNTISK